MRTLLISGLAEHMRGLPEGIAHSLAHELTCFVSGHVGKLRSQSESCLFPLSGLPCFPRETWNVHTLSVPWEAFHVAHGGNANLFTPSEVKAVCSAPDKLDAILAKQAANSGLWGGSLLAALGKILVGVRHDLVILSPYWRMDGVRSLLSTAGRTSYAGVKVRVFTRTAALMSADDRTAFIFFIDRMRASGAVVQAFTPKAMGGMTPFLHAKLIIADSTKAYVGSANFTNSGLDHGIEAGVLVEGEVAHAFAQWVNAIETACSGW
jgi:phosphatidylserine/phosphatidylglycerophosphate/cardiolipin synthase-like enzyme